MKEDDHTHNEGASPEVGDDIASSDDEVNMEDLMSTIMKGVSKAFSTSTANRSNLVPKTLEPEPVKQAKRSPRVSIRVLPNEASEINERKYKKIANNGVIKLFELINQS
ncbi:hypothetical protein X943_002177 [Babesia divergens]|uniref:Uncharacterized protein n=1 Tax=Babesia divergens TaxID=32595 RepID=A0AAD9GJK4_BABDI|nr:hypothetical protein X943_002177 [Babesia divergens]